MTVLENRVPPPIIAILMACLMWSLAQITYIWPLDYKVRLFLVAFALAVAVVFCVGGVLSFRKAKTTVNPLKPESASALVSSGIYRISRNPMYVGFAAILVAWLFYLAAPFAFMGVLLFVIYMNQFQIKPEERALERLFGLEFDVYRNKVRRWL